MAEVTTLADAVAELVHDGRGYRGTDLGRVTATVATVTCPFTREELTAVPALNPDVTVIHAQQADGQGNVMLWM